MFGTTSLALAAAAGGAALALLTTPAASADPTPQCSGSAMSTVCQSDGSAQIVATPPQIGGSSGMQGQNGSYGPSGNIPPVGN